MKLFTIGFTGKSAEDFFSLLETAHVRTLIDTRLNNRSQLAGFTKVGDLPFFLRRVAGISFQYAHELAPTAEILDAFKKKGMTWDAYADEYKRLLSERHVEQSLSRDMLDHGCLLCSEHQPSQCHRRLAAEYFKEKWRDVEVLHLK